MKDFVHTHSRAIIFIVAVLALAGIGAAFNLPISIFPDITFPRLVVLADNGEDPAERMMVTLTKPLEEAVNTVPGVRNVRSKTARGSVEISVDFDWGTDIVLAQQLLQAHVAAVRNQLPSAAEISVERMNAAFFPILGYAVTSRSRGLVEQRDLALYTIRPVLSRIHGVSQVRIVGGRSREYLVRIDPLKLAAYNLDIRQVSEALTKTNIIESVGLLDANYRLYLTLVDHMFSSIDGIRGTVVGSRGSTPILLGSIAEIVPSEKDEYIRVTSNGQEAVLVNVLKQPDGNTAQIAADVHAAMAELRRQLPSGVMVENFYDQSDIILDSFASLRDSIGVGVLLAIGIMFLFLRDWRVTVVVALIIPLTVTITLLLLFALRETFNIMTLGGIAAAIGLIIDDAIVITENTFRHFQGRHPSVAEAVKESTREMLPAIAGSSASTIVIFIPFAFLPGVTGAFFKSLAVTIAAALTVSLALSVLVIPILMARVIRPDALARHAGAGKNEKLHAGYGRALRFLLARRYLLLPLIILLVAGSVAIGTRLGSGFMPEMDEGGFVMDYASPPGTSLTETHRMLLQVEKSLMAIPEVESYSRRTGTQMGFFLTEPNDGDFLVKLKRRRSRAVDQIMDDLRARVQSSQPALRVEFGQTIQDLIGDMTSVPSPVEVKIFGVNKVLVEATAKRVAELIADVPGAVDVFNGITISGPSYIIVPEAGAVSRAGLTVEDVRDQLDMIVRGSVATEIQRGEKLIGVRVRLPDIYRNDIERVKSVRVSSPNGGTFLLGDLAAVKVDPGASEIQRENLKGMVAVTARTSGRDLGSVVADIQRRMSSAIVLPEGISVQYGGTYATSQESFRGLFFVLLAAVLLVSIVLVAEFDSYVIPAAITLVTLLSLSGVVLALLVTGVTLNISSFVGAIMIVGIVAENSIFLVHYYRKGIDSGLAVDDALVGAGVLRLRPIIMTALATVLALLPLAFGIGAGAQMQQPLAIAVIGGFTVSTLLLIFVLPMIVSLTARPK